MDSATFKVVVAVQGIALLSGVVGGAILAIAGEGFFDVLVLLSQVHGAVIALVTFLWVAEVRDRRQGPHLHLGLEPPPYGFAPGPARVAVIIGWLALALAFALRSRWPLVGAMPITTLLFAIWIPVLRRKEEEWEGQRWTRR